MQADRQQRALGGSPAGLPGSVDGDSERCCSTAAPDEEKKGIRGSSLAVGGAAAPPCRMRSSASALVAFEILSSTLLGMN